MHKVLKALPRAVVDESSGGKAVRLNISFNIDAGDEISVLFQSYC